MTMENLTRREFVATSLGALGAAALAGCSGNGVQKGEGSGFGAESTSSQPASDDPYATGTHHATIEVEGCGTIECALNANVAPITVANFCKLANEGFYDGLTFHRVIEGFMIQGGDPNGDGTGGSDATIKGEFAANGVENPLSHVRGTISMARSSAYDSASSQFFIMHKTNTSLDGQYAAFGNVTSGIEVVDAIAQNTPVQDSNGTVAAADQPKIEKISVVD
ncbi:peptidylprolyl isomerase [Paratractidigestivibacter sp.]|uniref:peptidylprolyl isomerase n=1 Tax=Paratractidigestivibacter sp. TaxID=2847316 RepID=UPI003AB27AA9